MRIKHYRVVGYLIILLTAFMVSACEGKSAGGGDNNTTASGSQWDAMKWDQGHWE